MQKLSPFSDYGSIVEGDRFVGRKKEIEQISGRLLSSDSFGNLAIMGLPRVGKSSLAWNSVMSQKEVLLQRKIVPIWLPFGEFASLFECFDQVTDEIIQSIDLENKSTVEECRKGFLHGSSSLEKRRYLKKYFKYIKNQGIRTILLFDEFDNAKTILDLQDFQFLRELSYNPETKIGIVTISRKSVQEIEPDEGILSNFYQIFTDLNLNLFNELDLAEYWARASRFGLTISEEYQNSVYQFVGHHPYLLDLFNSQVLMLLSDSGIELEHIINESQDKLKLKIFNEYESIIKLMKHEHLDRMMTQMIVGPVYDITQRDIERLLKYGLVLPSESEKYISFCPNFTQYLQLKAKDIQTWPLWNEVENAIRSLIKKQLVEKYGEDWENGYRKEFKNKEGKAEVLDGNARSLGLIKERSRSQKLFGNLASMSLIDYTLPNQMFDHFLSKDWNWYQKILGKQKQDWKPVFDHLSRVRNPLAHNNPNFLSQSDKSIAEGYCEKILELIRNWEKSLIQ